MASAEYRPTAALAAVVATPFDDCNLQCDDEPSYCSPGEHDAWWVPDPASHKYGGGYHSVSNPCFEGTCEVKHPSCGGMMEEGAPETFEYFRAAVARSDTKRVRAVMNSLGTKQIVVNQSRQAIQLLDCTGAVVAHLPVSARLIKALAEVGEE